MTEHNLTVRLDVDSVITAQTVGLPTVADVNDYIDHAVFAAIYTLRGVNLNQPPDIKRTPACDNIRLRRGERRVTLTEHERDLLRHLLTIAVEHPTIFGAPEHTNVTGILVQTANRIRGKLPR